MLDGHSRPSVHTVGGVLLGVSLDNKRSEVDGQFQFPKVYERYFRLIRSDYDSEHIKSSKLLDRLDGYDMLVALGTNSNMEGKGLPGDDNLALVSTTRCTGRAEAKSQVSVLYDRCCACFKCWLSSDQTVVHSAKLRLCSPSVPSWT